MRILFFALLVSSGAAYAASAVQELSAKVSKPSVDVYSAPDLRAERLLTLKRNDAVKIAGQQGLWYQVGTMPGKPGFVRVNDVRLAQARRDDGGPNVLFVGKSGLGRGSETAGVRGLDENQLRIAAANSVQLEKMQSYRVAAKAAEAYARKQGLTATAVAYAAEAKPVAVSQGGSTQAQKREGISQAQGAAGRLGMNSGRTNDAAEMASASAGKSEAEQQQEETALGPALAARVLGASPLWSDDAAQRRVNLIGRWVASNTSRPDLPWTFGVIATDDVNAFAMPGGYVLMTRGLYRRLDGDAELAAVLGHEISHVVQRDHYNVIHKQEIARAGAKIAMRNVKTPADDNPAAAYARDFVEKNGAAILARGLDRSAEYRSDEAAQIYLARSGYNPLALYSVLQKMASMGDKSGFLAQLYKTHPAMGKRLDQIDKRGQGVLEPYMSR